MFKRLPVKVRKMLTKKFYRFSVKSKKKMYFLKKYNKKRRRRLRKISAFQPYVKSFKRLKQIQYLRFKTYRKPLVKRRGRRQFRYSVRL